MPQQVAGDILCGKYVSPCLAKTKEREANSEASWCNLVHHRMQDGAMGGENSCLPDWAK